MSGPDFDELVGDAGTPEELARLRKAHDLLVAAGPPPELSPRLAEAPAVARAGRTWGALLPRRRATSVFFAVGLAAAAFWVGFLVGDRSPGTFPSKGSPITMHAVAPGSSAHASILIGNRDEVGNWPLLVHVSGLKPLPKGQWYELYLTRKGKELAWCGSFSVKKTGRTTVRLSVPYTLKSFDGWMVTTSVEPKQQALLTT